MLEHAILAVMLRAPGPDELEAPEERRARLEVIAEAIDLETETPPPGWRWGATALRALVLRTTYEEGGR